MSRPFNKQDQIEMAEAAIAEIERLRTHNAVLEPKAHAYDMLTQVLGLLEKPLGGFTRDLVWDMKRRIEELKAPAETEDGA